MLKYAVTTTTTTTVVIILIIIGCCRFVWYITREIFKQIHVCVISVFDNEVDEICTLLVYYAVYSDNSLPTFRDNQSVQTSRVPFLSLEVGADSSSRNLGKVSIRCVISEKSADLNAHIVLNTVLPCNAGHVKLTYCM